MNTTTLGSIPLDSVIYMWTNHFVKAKPNEWRRVRRISKMVPNFDENGVYKDQLVEATLKSVDGIPTEYLWKPDMIVHDEIDNPKFGDLRF